MNHFSFIEGRILKRGFGGPILQKKHHQRPVWISYFEGNVGYLHESKGDIAWLWVREVWGTSKELRSQDHCRLLTQSALLAVQDGPATISKSSAQRFVSHLCSQKLKSADQVKMDEKEQVKDKIWWRLETPIGICSPARLWSPWSGVLAKKMMKEVGGCNCFRDWNSKRWSKVLEKVC